MPNSILEWREKASRLETIRLILLVSFSMSLRYWLNWADSFSCSGPSCKIRFISMVRLRIPGKGIVDFMNHGGRQLAQGSHLVLVGGVCRGFP